MDESEDNMSAEDIKSENGQSGKTKPKKRSLVERELETNLTSRVTSPITYAEASSTSRYGRARRLKTETEFINFDKMVIKIEKLPTLEKTPVKVQSPVYKMHASNSPMLSESPKGTPNKVIKIEPNLENQIENIYHENISLSRFGSEEKKHSPNKTPKVYVRKDLIQKREEEESITLIKNLFSPAKSGNKSNSHINNILERSSEKYGLNTSSKSQNGYASVVKTLDFDSKKKRKDNSNARMLSKSELFEMEAKCEYQVGDLAWSRMGTYPFWPCIVTREPSSRMFVKKKLFGRVEHDVIHVTFFGDNGRRGWIIETMLRKFLGQLEFEATREQFTPADKKKDPRLYAAFFVSEKKLPQWNISVEEAELLLREPKRLRIDILNDMLMKPRALKNTSRQNKSGKITRTASDVSLSESLYDTLFSEDDGKEDSDRSRNKSLDVSEVVTACLDNMAARTGITKIQRQSHMDRWLQKAKSKTPEKSQARAQLVSQSVENKETKVSNAKKKRRSPKPNPRPLTQKPYSFRRSANESQLPHLENDRNNLEFVPSLNSTFNDIEDNSDGIINIEQLQSGIGIIAKVESLIDSANESIKDDDSEKHSDHEIRTDENNKCGTKNIQRNKANKSTNDIDIPLSDNQEIDLIETKSITESESYSVSSSLEGDKVPKDTKTKRSTNDIDIPLSDNQEIDLIEAKSITETDSYSVFSSLECDKVPIATKIKTLDSNEINQSSIKDDEKKNETVLEDKLVDSTEESKLLTEESREVDTITTESDKALDSCEIFSIGEKKDVSEIALQNSTEASITESVTDNLSPKLPNNLVNGDISDHNTFEKSSNDTDLTSELTRNSSSSQERSMSDSINTEVAIKPYTDPEFLKYVEIRQDNLMDQYPDLTQEEIVEYLHNTWLYEERSSGDTIKTEDAKQCNKRSNKSKPKSKKKQTRKTSQRKISASTDTIECEERLIEKPETIMNISNEIRHDIDVSEKLNIHINIASNEVSEINELKTTNELILNPDKDISNEVSNELYNFSENKSSESNLTVPYVESKESLDMKVSYSEKELLVKENMSESETYDPEREINAADSNNTVNDSAIDKPVCEQTSELNTRPEDNSNIIPCDKEMDTHEDMNKESLDMNVSYSKKELLVKENMSESETYDPEREINAAVSNNTVNDSAIDKPVCEQTSELNTRPEDNSNIIPCDKEMDTHEDMNKESLDMDVSYSEKELLVKENMSETETYDAEREINAADSNNTINDSAIDKPVCEQTSEVNIRPEDNSNIIPCDKEMDMHEDMNISYSKNKSHEQEIKETMTKDNLSVADSKFISNCQPIKVGVSDEAEVEIIANKEKEDNDMLISAVDLDDELSDDDSIDISYAISPLSVKGDEPNEDIKIEETDIHDNQNNEVHKQPIVNGVCNSDIENVVMDKETNSLDVVDKDMLNEAGPKENYFTKETDVSKETEHVLEDKKEEISALENDFTKETDVSKETEHVLEDKKEEISAYHTVPNKEIVDNIVIEVAKMNGTHVSKFIEDLEGDISSIHSEDSEPLSVTKSKLKLKKQERINKYADPEFVKYLEMRQDDVMDEHPELNQDEIVEYLYKTWLYEENSKSVIRKTDDVQQSILVKGLGDPKLETKKRKPREIKEKKIEKDTLIGKDSDVDTASVKSEESTTLKRWLRPKRYTSKLYADFDSSRDSSPAITDEVTSETISLNSMDSDDSRGNKYSSRSKASRPTKAKNDKLIVHDDIKVEKELLDVGLTKINSSPAMVNGFKNNDVVNIKEEFDPETASLNSEGSEVSLSKRKQKSKGDKKMDDPEFVKYLELRQDALIDENPQLTQEEIVSYLYKTWLYEESVKSDIKKVDEIEQSNLVKGINKDISLPKKVIRKKFKLEKDIDEETIKVKPKRKTIQPYYNEDYFDIEDEIAMFEIMKNSPKVELSKIDITGLKIKETESKTKSSTEKAKESIEQKEKESEVIEIEDEIDEVELFFEELAKPKPNIFKGLIREKVCEICEKVGNLVKCKGCNCMFHIDCVKHELDEVEKVSAPSKGRKKKKKKPGRKAKNLEDSGSMSDEKSQDVSAENMSLDDIIEPVTVDAVNFEAQLEAKMKELLESNDNEIHYDSYSSDDGIDWEGTIAGKCEIVDVKLKPKSQNNDYLDFKCNNCQKYDLPICFVCKLAISKTGVEYRQRCQVAHCHKYYHLECLDHWPQTQFTSGESRNKKTNEKVETHMCPRHVCHTCVSDDPRGCKTRFSGDKLARCVRCPATYHSFTKCLPAGTQILTGSHIICPRHYEHRPGKVPCHVNTGWCFICALGGTLICCEYCPTSFHAECLNISPPEGNYMCEDCETGRLPLYGEMVWVKLGHYRWWPGIILHPSEIPDNIMAVKHSPGEFVVRFFGQYDHYWVNRGRVFPFQEGDSGKVSSQKSKIDAAFTMAMEHAQRACQILKNAQENDEESLDIASSLLPPHYVKLKVNKPVGSLINKRVDIEESSLTQCDCDPSVPDPCGPYSQCLNRMLLTECGPICRAGDRCNNRAFEKRQYPKMAPYRTPQRGWGLKTLEDIKAGQFVIEYVGELIDEEEFKRRMARKHEIRDENFYFLTLDKERMIDAGPKGNLARFMNHCCEPNCETQKWTVLGDVRVGLFAIHDIPANSEVTFNYNLECAGIDKKRCMCGAKRCAGYIGAKPKQDESQPKKPKFAAKRTYKKRKNTEESPSTKNKLKRPVGRPPKQKELTEIEKDLLIIKNATNGISSDSECSRLSSVEGDRQKALKRKRVSFSTEEVVFNGSPSVKKVKLDEDKVD